MEMGLDESRRPFHRQGRETSNSEVLSQLLSDAVTKRLREKGISQLTSSQLQVTAHHSRNAKTVGHILSIFKSREDECMHAAVS